MVTKTIPKFLRKWQGCPVMPVLAKHRPDLLREAEAVGNLVGLTLDFIMKHKLCDRKFLGDHVTARGKHAIAQEVIRTLRNGS